MRQSDLLTPSSWQSFIILISWYNIRDCLPVLIFFTLGIYVNYSIGTYSLKYAIKRFCFYFTFGLYIYFIHVLAGGIEQQLFGKLVNIFEYYVLSCIIMELNNFYNPNNANLDLKHPILDLIFDKVNKLIELTFKK